MTGRPTKCTPERAKRIIDALKGGNTRTASATYGGVDLETLSNWMKRGAKGEEPFLGFSVQVKEAEAEAEIRNVAIIQKAALTKWQAAAWWLERRRAKNYALTQKHTGGDGVGPVRVSIEDIAQRVREGEERGEAFESDVVDGLVPMAEVDP